MSQLVLGYYKIMSIYIFCSLSFFITIVVIYITYLISACYIRNVTKISKVCSILRASAVLVIVVVTIILAENNCIVPNVKAAFKQNFQNYMPVKILMFSTKTYSIKSFVGHSKACTSSPWWICSIYI